MSEMYSCPLLAWPPTVCSVRLRDLEQLWHMHKVQLHETQSLEEAQTLGQTVATDSTLISLFLSLSPPFHALCGRMSVRMEGSPWSDPLEHTCDASRPCQPSTWSGYVADGIRKGGPGASSVSQPGKEETDRQTDRKDMSCVVWLILV
mmetsp:Transcript_34578/g.85706  ORF Transcript_34578/g.85706 Transcript_34578/m.85706 type:complete len:148 (+) Transcript_34578:1144-1587(+)